MPPILASDGTILRAETKPRYDTLNWFWLAEVGEVMGNAAARYGKTTYVDKATPPFAADILNHAFEHLLKFNMGDTSEPHLAHAGANLMMYAAIRHRYPEWFDENGVLLCPSSNTAPIAESTSEPLQTKSRPARATAGMPGGRQSKNGSRKLSHRNQ